MTKDTQAVAEQSDEEPEVDAGGTAVVPDSVKLIGPFESDAKLDVCHIIELWISSALTLFIGLNVLE